MNNINKQLNYIQAFSKRFAKESERLRTADIKLKPKLFPFKESSTTLGNTVWLAYAWESWDIEDQCANLIHEAAHLDQWDRKGWSAMAWQYAQPSWRLALEMEASAKELLWYKDFYKWPKFPSASAAGKVPIIAGVLYHLQTGYFTSPDKAFLETWAFAVVNQ